MIDASIEHIEQHAPLASALRCVAGAAFSWLRRPADRECVDRADRLSRPDFVLRSCSEPPSSAGSRPSSTVCAAPTASLIQCPCMSGWPSPRRGGFQQGGAVVCPIAGPDAVHAIGTRGSSHRTGRSKIHVTPPLKSERRLTPRCRMEFATVSSFVETPAGER